MARVLFTPNLERHLECPPNEVDAVDVRGALEATFEENADLRGYILDDRGFLRKHVIVFVDGRQVNDREGLSDEVGRESEVYVMQALSGGTKENP